MVTSNASEEVFTTLAEVEKQWGDYEMAKLYQFSCQYFVLPMQKPLHQGQDSNDDKPCILNQTQRDKVQCQEYIKKETPATPPKQPQQETQDHHQPN